MISRVIFFLIALSTAYSMIPVEVDSIERSSRIIGGAFVANTAVASLRTRSLQGNSHLCGAFIINQNWIGTAAQCVNDREDRPQDFLVGVGTNSITTTRNYEVGLIIKHEGFDV